MLFTKLGGVVYPGPPKTNSYREKNLNLGTTDNKSALPLPPPPPLPLTTKKRLPDSSMNYIATRKQIVPSLNCLTELISLSTYSPFPMLELTPAAFGVTKWFVVNKTSSKVT